MGGNTKPAGLSYNRIVSPYEISQIPLTSTMLTHCLLKHQNG